MKRKKSIAPFLKGLLTFILCISTLVAILLIISPYSTISTKVIQLSTICVFIVATYDFRKIVSTVIKKSPFHKDNVKRFRRIGYLIFVLSLVDIVINFYNTEGSLLIGTPYGNIHTSVLLYFVIGGIALVLSEIFKEAIEIKEENDLTI